MGQQDNPYGYPPAPEGYPGPPPQAGPYYTPPPAGYPSAAGPPPGAQYVNYPPPMGIGGMPPAMPPRPGANYGGAYQQAGQPAPGGYAQQPKPQGAHVDVEAQQAASYANAFAQQKIRSAFVRKVFCLVMLELAVTIGTAAAFIFVVPLNEYVAGVKVCTTSRTTGEESCSRLVPEGQWVFFTSWVLTIVMLIAFMCSNTLRRKHPWNLLSMAVFTAVLSVQVGCICAWWSLDVVLIAVAVTGAAVLGLTLAAVFLPWDITKRGNVLAMAGIVVFFIAIVTMFVGIFYVNKWWYLALSVVFALLFSAYLVYDIQMVMGGKSFAASPDEYVFASVQIYLDIVMLFLQLLSIIGIAKS